MCLVIDTCCLTMVFDGNNQLHSGFQSVLRWITGKGCMIYGGTKYNEELRRLTKILPLVVELAKQRKAIQIENPSVDAIAAQLKRKYPEDEFNDEHIVALVIASRCRVVCTNDNAAISYLRRPDVFAGSGASRPSIYRGLRVHQRLCCDRNIVAVCQHR